jgi:hypothetical protein
MKFGTLTFLTTEVLFGVPAIPVRLAAQNTSSEITIIDAPGAGTGGVQSADPCEGMSRDADTFPLLADQSYARTQ